MLLSFSEAPMLPYIRAGIRQAFGEDVGDERVKRQTIRGDGPRARKLLEFDPIGHTIGMPLHLWWKSRTPQRKLLGVIPPWLVRIYGIVICHDMVRQLQQADYPRVWIEGPQGWRDGPRTTVAWSPGRVGGSGFIREAYNDGFDSPEAFRDYFVPNPGDRFDAILFKW